jgi:5'-nucleotidase / UDP-sugar diphosphatase
MRILPLSLSLSVLALLAACASTSTAPLAPVAGPVKLTVLHTNDHHGRFWRNGDGEGGLAARATLVKQIRDEVKASGGHVVLLDAGDVNTGVPESDLQDAEPDFKGMSAMGYEAMALGNHEFDKPLAVLAKQKQWSNFPFLSANIYDKSGKRIYPSHVTLDRAGLKISVVGLTTEDTPKLTDPANTQSIEFRPALAEAKSLVPQLRQQSHIVIGLTHVGHYTDGKSGVNAPGDVELARGVPGLDLLIGGHSHNPVCMRAANQRNDAYVAGTPCQPDQQGKTWIVQAHEWGKYVGRADFTYANGELKLDRYQLLPVNLKRTVKGADGKDTKTFVATEIKEDPAMLALLQPFADKGRAALDVTVGESDGALNGRREDVRSKPTNMGVFIASVMMQKAKADLAIMNSGGIRDSMPAGKLTYKDVLKVQPFGNQLVSVDLKGNELMTYLNAAAKMTAGSGAFPQFAGVRLVIENGAVTSATIKGQPIDTAKTYRLALNSFQANGGDGYPKLSDHPGYVNTGFVDADVMREFLSKNKVNIAGFEPADAVVRR